MGVQLYQVETECINQLATDGFGLTFPCRLREPMRRRGANLVDVRRVLATGRVINSDMLEQRGLWVVSGEMVDGGKLVVTVAVNSSEYEVEVMDLS